ncbi:hypothetical protein M3Y94_00310700 [Aphelenchoides besseyi]|nr:hypothetical protein M3Y94_00310700 [Aphelenchoides besseyi]
MLNFLRASLIIALFKIISAQSSVHPQWNKQLVSQLDEGQFEIVNPFQIRERKERIGIDTHNYFLNASTHYKHIVIVIKSTVVFGDRIRFKLILNLNEHLFYNSTQFEKLTADGEEFLPYRVENCYYQGTVNGDPSTFVAISTCNGLRGIIAYENGTALGIWPLNIDDRSRKQAHVFYRTRWSRDATCGAVTQVPSQTSALIKTPVKRDVSRQVKYVELAVIGDYQFVKEMNLTEDEAVEFMLEVVNIADAMLSRELNIRLSVVYNEIWLDAQRIDVHSDIERTLSGTLEYITGHIYQVEKDASILFTGGYFANNEMLTASFASICTSRAAGIVKVLDSYTVHNVAQFVAHVVGHILGIDHDSSDCTCASQLPCVMNKQAGSIGAPFAWQFSKCSVARMHNVLQSGHIQCLLNRPFQTSQLHQCGNGVVDGDEECDCGRREQCADPCCDPITCTLRAHAQCAAHHVCCHRCELLKQGHLCRSARSVCDVPEVCDGVNGNCPTDGYLVDGIQCGLNGHCWKGNCSDTQQQCRNLWGDNAIAGEEACYDQNEKGVEYGNCGRDRNGKFVSCETENRLCGTLHCKSGLSYPRFSNLTSFNYQFLKDGHQVQCKSITNVGVGLVADGTSCGSGRICVEGSCLPLAQVSPPVHCPSNNLALQCSGHGDCTTTQSCLCYDGWNGIACDQRSNTSRRPTFGLQQEEHSNGVHLLVPSIRMNPSWDDTSTLLGVVIVVGIFFALILFFLVCCYRRRSSSVFQRQLTEKKPDESFQEDGNRVIKFGPTPSWTKEKRNRKKNKHVYGALQRINEAADERDSTSLRSRDSAALSVASSLRQMPSTHGSAINAAMHDRPMSSARSQIGVSAAVYADDSAAISRHLSPLTASPSAAYVPQRHMRDSLLDRVAHAPLTDNYESDLLNGIQFPLYPSSTSYNRTRVPPSASIASPNGSISSRTGSLSGRLTSGQLKLPSFQSILRKVDSEQLSAGGSERDYTEELKTFGVEQLNYLRTSDASGLPDPPPASVDSGRPNSQFDIRESPSLFSDPFKLDVSNS